LQGAVSIQQSAFSQLRFAPTQLEIIATRPFLG